MNSLRQILGQHWEPLPPLARKAIVTLLATLVILVVALFSVQGGSQNSVSFSDSFSGGQAFSTPAPSTADSFRPTGSIETKVVVQVVGRVKNPGVYELPSDSRVLDAIFLAGGFESDADQASLNLARPLNDGEQLIVLAKNTAGVSTQSGLMSGSGSGNLISINLADAGTLDSLPGIGPALAQRIVDYRSANGGFRTIGDLEKVAGIGPSLLARLKNLVTL